MPRFLPTLQLEPSARMTDVASGTAEDGDEKHMQLRYHRVLTLCTWTNVCTFSVIGALVRLQLSSLRLYDGYLLFGSLYPQLIGCILIGFISEHKQLLLKLRLDSLYFGIATGLCGSITTFSSWQLEMSSTLVRWPGKAVYYAAIPAGVAGTPHRSLMWITLFVSCMAASLAGLTVGKHLSHLSPFRNRKYRDMAAVGQCAGFSQGTLRAYVITCIAVNVVFMLTFLALTAFLFDHKALFFTGIFAPFGACLRYWLSRFNNKRPNLPAGTLAANVLGSAVLAVCSVVALRYGCFRDQPWRHGIVSGVAGGFCGCVSTVSTFMTELARMKPRHGYVYVLLSVGSCQCVALTVQAVGMVVLADQAESSPCR